MTWYCVFLLKLQSTLCEKLERIYNGRRRAMLDKVVILSEPNLIKAVIVCVLTPVIWNIVARLEFYTHILTKIACNNKYIGAYALAVYIFTFSLYRDYLFNQAVATQPTWSFLEQFSPYTQYIGYVIGGIGSIFVLSSMWKLGITGTYLGDYFGILMDEPVTSFPFNVMRNPMYDGATMVFLGQALVANSAAGILMTVVIYVTYHIALLFEGPFTDMIYAQRAAKANSSSSDASSKATKKKRAMKID
jgi:phosphatidylethanolamine N-methyltransferase